MTTEKMIKELIAAQFSVLAHPDNKRDSEFGGTADRIGKVIEGLKCYGLKTYDEPIRGIEIGKTSAMILGHDYVVRGADWNTKEVVLTPK
jgi:hypothetical protein